jgi:hypothetical protein
MMLEVRLNEFLTEIKLTFDHMKYIFGYQFHEGNLTLQYVTQSCSMNTFSCQI